MGFSGKDDTSGLLAPNELATLNQPPWYAPGCFAHYKTHNRYFARSTINSLVRRIKIKQRFVPFGGEQKIWNNKYISVLFGKYSLLENERVLPRLRCAGLYCNSRTSAWIVSRFRISVERVNWHERMRGTKFSLNSSHSSDIIGIIHSNFLRFPRILFFLLLHIVAVPLFVISSIFEERKDRELQLNTNNSEFDFPCWNTRSTLETRSPRVAYKHFFGLSILCKFVFDSNSKEEGTEIDEKVNEVSWWSKLNEFRSPVSTSRHFYKPLINISFPNLDIISMYIYIYIPETKVPIFLSTSVERSRWIIVIRPILFGWTTRSKEIKWDWIIERDSIRPRRIQNQCGESNRDDQPLTPFSTPFHPGSRSNFTVQILPYYRIYISLASKKSWEKNYHVKLANFQENGKDERCIQGEE